jgi:hypothetical protein
MNDLLNLDGEQAPQNCKLVDEVVTPAIQIFSSVTTERKITILVYTQGITENVDPVVCICKV